MLPLQNNEYSRLLHHVKTRVRTSFGERFVRLVVFGSVARGTAQHDSDIDMMLFVRTSSPSDRDTIAEICSEMLLEYGVVLSLFCVTERAFDERPFSPLYRNIKQEGITI